MVYSSALKLVISRRAISLAVKRLAESIGNDYAGQNPLLLGVLKGSFVFLSDLARQLDFKIEVDFLCCRSYAETESSGKVELVLPPRARLTGRHILLVEDIVDTGLTTSYLNKYIRNHNPVSLRLCALLDKPSRRREKVDIYYLGFTVPDEFIVGYGLDCAEEYRNLPGLYRLEHHHEA
jgi:hypoxanthine phosphoribosyltransferase